jgi:hypothetical protein
MKQRRLCKATSGVFKLVGMGRDGGSGIPVPSCWSGMVPECGESHLSLTLVHPLLVQNGAGPIPVQYRPASFRTMCASSPIPDQYRPLVMDGDDCSPIPDNGFGRSTSSPIPDPYRPIS